MPREESFPIPLTCIYVIRSTHTDWDVAQEKRIDDYWNVEENRSLSDSLTGFTRFALLNGKTPEGFMWSGWRLTKIQTTSRPDHIWPDAWMSIGKAAQRREKQEWAIEKPKREYARNLRETYSIDPSDEKYKDDIKNARRKLETPVAAAMPCKRAFSQASIRDTEHIAVKGENYVVYYNLVQKFIPTRRSPSSPKMKARARCFVSRRNVHVRIFLIGHLKIQRVQDVLKNGTGKKEVQTLDVILLRQSRQIMSTI